jgi:hypothetical protein
VVARCAGNEVGAAAWGGCAGKKAAARGRRRRRGWLRVARGRRWGRPRGEEVSGMEVGAAAVAGVGSDGGDGRNRTVGIQAGAWLCLVYTIVLRISRDNNYFTILNYRDS